MELRKESGIKMYRSIEVSIDRGKVIISDYSHNNDRDKLLALMVALGVSPEKINESWCG